MKRILALMLLCTLLCGCANSRPQAADTTAPPLAPIVVEPDTPAHDDRTAAAQFALDLLRQQKFSEQNTILSPLSVLAALGMTANGAGGNTLRQMEETLGFTASRLCAIMPGLLTENEQLHMANGIWYRNAGMTVYPEFLDACANYYNAAATPTPMDETTRKAINAFIEEHTHGMIPDMMPENSIDAHIVMLLVNALAFDADWATAFESFRNEKAGFAGSDTPATYMQSTERLYLSGRDAVGFIKPYAGGRYAFAAILPDEGIALADYLAALDGAALIDLLDGVSDATVIARLPKFSYDYDADLADSLSAMGMPDAFDGGVADFSRLGSAVEGNIFIEKVLHRAHIDVGEEGTEAAAATVVVAVPETVWMPPKDAKLVYLTRPFLYMIIDCENHLPVFIGTIVDPS
ncbi:MAG: serpin family protein [Clostridia bacterium]|nr:serpin family protein [Clostridia bacterium]